MTATYLHGVETIQATKGAKTVTVVKTAVIGLVGTAPMGAVNALAWCRSANDDAQFGSVLLTGWSIPRALATIRQYLPGADVLVVNVADPAKAGHKTAVAAESKTFALNTLTLANGPIVGALVVTNVGATVTYVVNTDYTFDPQTRVVTRVTTGAIPNNATVAVSYTYLDATKPGATDVIGSVDPTTELKSGLELLRDAKGLYGFKARLLIAPGFSELNSVEVALLAKADAMRAFPGIDAPLGTTVTGAIAGRGPAGTINFYTSNKRARLLFPRVKVADESGTGTRLAHLSVRWAALVAKVHQDEGYWVSESNHELVDVQGLERPITFDLTDASCDANQLNAVGITTVAAGYGTGYRLWGNRTAAWPSSTDPHNFAAVQMMCDVAAESIEDALLQYIDKPITLANIDEIVETVNRFYRVMKMRGAIVDGRCYFDPAQNDPTEVANGHLTFSHDLGPDFPLEHITNLQAIDTSLVAAALGLK